MRPAARLATAALALAASVVMLGAGGQPPAGETITRAVWSQSLGTRKNVVVYLPPSYGRDTARRYPVAYYLHGMYGAETDWSRAGHLPLVADSLAARGLPEMIVVMPDGDDAWWTTSNSLGSAADCRRDTVRREPAATYCVPWPHYDDYVARDLVAWVDSTFRTRADRAHRGIAGLSMGGYGAVTLALRYPEVFSAAASHSGVLSPRYVGPHPFAGAPRYGRTEDELRAGRDPGLWRYMHPVFGRDTLAWRARDPVVLAEALRRRAPAMMPALFADVGAADPYADENRAFRAELARLGVPIAYHEWPGTHDWAYWRAHVGESLAWLDARIAR